MKISRLRRTDLPVTHPRGDFEMRETRKRRSTVRTYETLMRKRARDIGAKGKTRSSDSAGDWRERMPGRPTTFRAVVTSSTEPDRRRYPRKLLDRPMLHRSNCAIS